MTYAKKVASYLNVPLEIIDMDSGILIQGLKDMIIKLEEPLADPTAINVLYISRLARKTVLKFFYQDQEEMIFFLDIGDIWL